MILFQKMIFDFRFFLIALISFLSVHVFAEQMTMLPGEVTNFELPRFDEKSGNKLWELFGKKAKFLGEDKITATDVRLDLFDKKTALLRAVATSPSANVSVSKKFVDSPSQLFIKGEEFDLSGKKWSWDGEADIVQIFSEVQINFNPKADKKKSKGKDSIATQKIKITGDSAKLDNGGRDNKFYIDGNARVRSENLAVDCDTIETVSDDKGGKVGSKDVSFINAQGNVVMTRDNRLARAQKAMIFARENEAILSGNPEIEDLSSKAKLSGDKIQFLKETKSVKAYSAKDFSKRASAVFFHTDESGKSQKIEVEANEILMTSEETQNRFVFLGNVRVKSDDLLAKCGKITVLAKNIEKEKPEVKIIECRGNVYLHNSDGDASAQEMDIYPTEEKTQLRGNVVLENAKDSSRLTARKLTLFKKDNSGIAESSNSGYVRLSIPESASESAVSAINPTSAKSSAKKKVFGKQKKAKESIISSRTIDFKRVGDNSKFTFLKDVSIVSKSVSASCEKMIVYTVSGTGKSGKIEKIEAFEKVRVIQNAYSASAEMAVIYPKVDSADKEKQPHKFVELLTSPEKPNLRPKILLPPMRNMGFDSPSAQRKSRPRMTVITSDKQWLMSYEKIDKYFFEGNVKITATDTEGSCGKIETSITPPERNKRREISEIIFRENVSLTQGLKEITCGKAHIYAKDEVAVLTQNPIIFNREDNTRAAGSKIVYNKGSKLVSIQNDSLDDVDEFSEIDKKRPTIQLPEFELKKR